LVNFVKRRDEKYHQNRDQKPKIAKQRDVGMRKGPNGKIREDRVLGNVCAFADEEMILLQRFRRRRRK
jgi:hypothetical protein